jgi:hypothetical protein
MIKKLVDTFKKIDNLELRDWVFGKEKGDNRSRAFKKYLSKNLVYIHPSLKIRNIYPLIHTLEKNKIKI